MGGNVGVTGSLVRAGKRCISTLYCEVPCMQVHPPSNESSVCMHAVFESDTLALCWYINLPYYVLPWSALSHNVVGNHLSV